MCRKVTLLKSLLMRLIPHQFQCKRYELSWTNDFLSYFGVWISAKSTTWWKEKIGRMEDHLLARTGVGRSSISSLLSAERCWSHMLSRYLRSINPLIRRELRLLGSNFSFGNDSMFSHLPSISKWLRQSSPCSPRSFPSMSLSQKVTQNKLRLEGQPPSGCDSSSGHLFKNMDWRFLRVCNWSGRFLRFLQLDNQMDVRLGVGNTPFGKYTRLGQSLISKASRDVRCSWIPSGFESDSRFAQSQIERHLSVGNKYNDRDVKESQLFPLHKFSRNAYRSLFSAGLINSNFLQLQV